MNWDSPDFAPAGSGLQAKWLWCALEVHVNKEVPLPGRQMSSPQVPEDDRSGQLQSFSSSA